ncbi:MAG: hypothetical protein IPP74_06545 [Alphaproteobacteria bacterium]|nr:hypothetical protein [Alphaproteobacteria bacterium]
MVVGSNLEVKVIEHITDASKQSGNVIIDELLLEGKTVEIIPRTNAHQTADSIIDGVDYELKTISNLTTNNISEAVKRTIIDASKQSGNVIIDAKNQPQVTKEVVDNLINRIPGSGGGSRVKSIIIITSEGTINHQF